MQGLNYIALVGIFLGVSWFLRLTLMQTVNETDNKMVEEKYESR